MTPWSYWFPDVLPHVPGCPQVIMEHELRRAAQAFFRQTKAWRVTQAPIPVAAGTAEVSATPLAAGQELVRVDAAWYDGTRIDPVTPEMLDAQYFDDWQARTGKPQQFLQEVPGAVRLYPIPTDPAVTGLRLRLIVAPSDAATGLPDDQAVKFKDVIQVGAKSRLMLYPGKTWTNAELAAVYGQAFNQLVGQATAEAARAYAQARLPARVNWC